jgi:hypothetical protein
VIDITLSQPPEDPPQMYPPLQKEPVPECLELEPVTGSSMVIEDKVTLHSIQPSTLTGEFWNILSTETYL